MCTEKEAHLRRWAMKFGLRFYKAKRASGYELFYAPLDRKIADCSSLEDVESALRRFIQKSIGGRR